MVYAGQKEEDKEDGDKKKEEEEGGRGWRVGDGWRETVEWGNGRYHGEDNERKWKRSYSIVYTLGTDTIDSLISTLGL